MSKENDSECPKERNKSLATHDSIFSVLIWDKFLSVPPTRRINFFGKSKMHQNIVLSESVSALDRENVSDGNGIYSLGGT